MTTKAQKERTQADDAQLLAGFVPGARYTMARLMKMHGVGRASLQVSLGRLMAQNLLHDEMRGRMVVYFVRPAPVIIAAPSLRPLRLSVEMQYARDRCAELYIHPSKR